MFLSTLGIHKKNLDQWGMIVQNSKDGGDSCQRMGLIALYCWLIKDQDLRFFNRAKKWYHSVVHQLECIECKDHYRRHPDLRLWYSDCDRLSRDQATPLVIGMGVMGEHKRLKRFMWHHIKRLGFMTNTRHNWTYKIKAEHENAIEKGWLKPRDPFRPGWKLPDFCGPEFIGLYIRSLNWWWAYPFLYISDLELLINSIVQYFRQGRYDPSNYVPILIYTKFKYPTFLGRISRYIASKSKLEQRFNDYFSPPESPERIAELYRPFITSLTD